MCIRDRSFETKFELGIKTVRADFMSDHTLALTFSEHPGSDEIDVYKRQEICDFVIDNRDEQGSERILQLLNF